MFSATVCGWRRRTERTTCAAVSSHTRWRSPHPSALTSGVKHQSKAKSSAAKDDRENNQGTKGNLPAEPSGGTQQNLPAVRTFQRNPAGPSSGTLQWNLPAEPSSGTFQRNLVAEPSRGTQRNPAERSSGTQQNLPAKPSRGTHRNLPTEPSGTH